MKYINIKKLSTKLSNQDIKVEIATFDFKYYQLKLSFVNDCFNIVKINYLPKNWYYQWMKEEIQRRKKLFRENWKNGNEKYFDTFIVY